MFLQNSQPVIEIILMVVLIAGIVSSRLIVRRLGVIRESYTALNEMVGTLDSSTEQVNQLFERVHHQVGQGDKRLSALLERARNAEEDLLDQTKMAQESGHALSDVLGKAEEREATLKARLEAAQASLTMLAEQMKAQQDALEQAKLATEAATGATNIADSAAQAGITAQDRGADEVKNGGQGDAEGMASGIVPGNRSEETPHFSDRVEMPAPERLRGPRPYLRGKELESRKQAM